MSINPPNLFVLQSDETNSGVIESYSSICKRLVAASREMDIVEIVQRIHIDKKHSTANAPRVGVSK
jgi:hypothetical protein